MGCNERVGNLKLLLCLSYTTEGIALLQPGLRKHNISLRAFRNCIKLQLGFQKWIHEFNDKEEVDNAAPLLAELITQIKHCFPRNEGNGWKIPKMHAYAKMLYHTQKFGCAAGFSGETGERCLKAIVKDMSRVTQGRAGVFAEQCALRLYETSVFKHAFECSVVPAMALDYEKRININDVKECEGRGEFTLTIEDVDHHGRGYTNVIWKSTDREKLHIGISELMKIAILKFASDNHWTGLFQVTGYTSYKMKPKGYHESVLFHANEFTHGGEWYDWCMVQFDGDEDEDLEDSVCPAKILGFFKYCGAGIPTPHLITEMGYSHQHIYCEGLEDETVYAVVHSAVNMLPWYTIEQEFISPFHLGPVDSCVYIIDVDTIVDPLFVIKDYGGKGSNSERYFCSLPYEKWGRYFGDKVERGEEDKEDSEDE